MTTWPATPPPFDTPDLFARIVWAEARSQGQAGMEAVASVICNRAANPRWWGRDLLGVLVGPWQFSCLLPESAGGQLARIHAVTMADALFRQAVGITASALAGTLVDRTANSDHYANMHLCSPAWARGKTPATVIGAHSFYRIELRPPSGAKPLPPIQQQLHAGTGVVTPPESEADRLNKASLAAIRAGRT